MSVLTVLARPTRALARVLGYLRSSDDDLRAVYGDDPNGARNPTNPSGNIAANAIGGIAGG